MIDPVTAVGLATSAFNILKQGISAGKDIQEMSGTLAKWGSAFSDFQYAEDKTKNPPFYKMMSDNSANAIEIFAQKKKMEAMRKEIKDHISWTYGPSAWEEVLSIEAEMRRIRKEQAYKKQEAIDNAINFIVGTVIFLIASVGVVTGFYYLGRYQGKW
jgi:molecular chaperone GrpE (heat shock protein)